MSLIWHIKQNENPLASKSNLKRGFKTKAEKIAKKYREELNIHPCAPLDAFKLASHLSVPIYNFGDFEEDKSKLNRVLNSENGRSHLSALTMTTAAGNRIIIHNTFHSAPRQQSNIMHELAHIICEHKLANKDYGFDIPIGMREFNAEQEDEAICLGATLQLATPCLLWAKKRGMDKEQIASYFNASTEMVIYRLNLTGIARRASKRSF